MSLSDEEVQVQLPGIVCGMCRVARAAHVRLSLQEGYRALLRDKGESGGSSDIHTACCDIVAQYVGGEFGEEKEEEETGG